MEKMSNYISSLLSGREELALHSKEVSQLAYEFGIYLGLGYKDLKNLKFGGLIHDIGKTEIPEEVLFKTDRLTEEEFSLIKEHPIKGQEILSRTKHSFSQDVIDIVLQHHERIDGRGYPSNLKGNEINVLAKIVSLCDVFSAIVSARSYKDSFSQEYALEQIEKGFDTQFDRDLGENFVKFMKQKHIAKINRHISIL